MRAKTILEFDKEFEAFLKHAKPGDRYQLKAKFGAVPESVVKTLNVGNVMRIELEGEERWLSIAGHGVNVNSLEQELELRVLDSKEVPVKPLT